MFAKFKFKYIRKSQIHFCVTSHESIFFFFKYHRYRRHEIIIVGDLRLLHSTVCITTEAEELW